MGKEEILKDTYQIVISRGRTKFMGGNERYLLLLTLDTFQIIIIGLVNCIEK